MKIEQIYTGCLAQGAYYIESNGEVAIIDPLRETQQYIDKAKSENAKIKYVFETHFHADFVSGHVDLAKKTGATIVFVLEVFRIQCTCKNRVDKVENCDDGAISYNNNR